MLILKTTLTITGQKIRVEMLPCLIRIVNDGALKRLVWKAPDENTFQLVTRIREEYQHWAGEELAISGKSLVVEIWGHLLVERYALKMRRMINIEVSNKFIRFLLKRMAIIDCGARSIDHNRFFWDGMVPFKKLFVWLLPRPK